MVLESLFFGGGFFFSLGDDGIGAGDLEAIGLGIDLGGP
jgi:hypothetical protein